MYAYQFPARLIILLKMITTQLKTVALQFDFLSFEK